MIVHGSLPSLPRQSMPALRLPSGLCQRNGPAKCAVLGTFLGHSRLELFSKLARKSKANSPCSVLPANVIAPGAKRQSSCPGGCHCGHEIRPRNGKVGNKALTVASSATGYFAGPRSFARKADKSPAKLMRWLGIVLEAIVTEAVRGHCCSSASSA